ncbi:MAG: 2-amino-4-hydroxy-6-hydroxymethyldihydropteridine diphosphokinase [Gammaproteobacteria bacterium]|nr:2-amino-4-hydroxy-6-hydroxymethyldihydropteridine diphosphokinase [Gammaproteobacteria bacterium]
MTQVYVSVGSNIEKTANIRFAIRMLRRRYGVLTLSRIYESVAVGFDGGNFYNLVVGFDTQSSAFSVIRSLHRLEKLRKRTRQGQKFISRTLDLDLLLYGNRITCRGRLRLPRDEISKYAFVLLPLAEIAPTQQQLLTKRQYRSLWKAFDDSAQRLWPVRLRHY